MDYTIHGVSKSQTGLSDFHFHWLVLMRWGGRQPAFNTGRRESLAPPSVRDGNCTLCLTGAVAVCLGPVPVAQTVKYLRVIQKTHVPWVRKIPWRRKLQPTPVFLPEESLGQRSLVGYSPWGHKESDTTERPTLSLGPVLHSSLQFKCSSTSKVSVKSSDVLYELLVY